MYMIKKALHCKNSFQDKAFRLHSKDDCIKILRHEWLLSSERSKTSQIVGKITFADRMTQVLQSFILRARRSALLIGDPSIKEILGRFFSKYHSLQTQDFFVRMNSEGCFNNTFK